MLRTADEALELALAPMDRARVRLLVWLRPLSGPLAGSRELRVAVIGVSVVAFALLACLAAPLWVLALGPIVLGVPHLLADLRYCVVRPGWHRERALWLTGAVPLVAIGLGFDLWLGLLGVAACALVIDGPRRRRGAVALVGLGLAGLAWTLDSTADLILAHAHNFVAVALWAAWRRRRGRLAWAPMVAFGLACAVLLTGMGDLTWASPARSPIGASIPSGLDGRVHLESLAPGLEGPWAIRLVLLYCFAQSVHYGVWLRLIPEDDRDRPTPRTFRASYRALRREIHPLILAAFALGALLLAGWAVADLVAARTGYLRFARFHGVLELMVAGLLISTGSRGRTPT